MKVLRCRDSGFDCEGKIRADSEEEVMRQTAEHAQREHNTAVTPTWRRRFGSSFGTSQLNGGVFPDGADIRLEYLREQRRSARW